MAKRPIHVCRTCGRVLDYEEGVGYDHSLGEQRLVDHPADPVPQSEAVATVGRCDFCFADFPEWLVPARDFEVMPGHMSDGDWSACAECVRLIESNQWARLLRRARQSWERRHEEVMPPAMEAGLARMYRLLRKHISGSPYPNPHGLPERLPPGADPNVSGRYGRGSKRS